MSANVWMESVNLLKRGIYWNLHWSFFFVGIVFQVHSLYQWTIQTVKLYLYLLIWLAGKQMAPGKIRHKLRMFSRLFFD